MSKEKCPRFINRLGILYWKKGPRTYCVVSVKESQEGKAGLRTSKGIKRKPSSDRNTG